MKRLFFFVMAAFITITAYAETSYRLPFVSTKDGITKIPFVEKEWTIGSDKDDWSLYIEKGMLDKHKSIYEFHAVTAYKVPYHSNGLKTYISKIYTYGVLNCKQANLSILYEWYVDPEETLIYTSSFEYGEYIIEMIAPNTARDEIYNQICKESI